VNIRCDLHINGGVRKPYLVCGPSEPVDHLAHRLAAYILFWDFEPILDASAKTPALAAFEFMPDLIALEDDGAPKLWVECGTVTMHKLTKITRRAPRCRIVIMKENAYQAQRLRTELEDSFDRPGRVEILAWPDGLYKDWARAVGEKTEAFGEASGHMINAVVNETPVLVEFMSY
jgi:hypothetical protein